MTLAAGIALFVLIAITTWLATADSRAFLENAGCLPMIGALVALGVFVFETGSWVGGALTILVWAGLGWMHAARAFRK